ncbi:hypothetical protein [Endozoicomonas arenosclerae]|uniref:hypothetical protein n=1 Tax=Endozoicomonas arenosclerae TaxID=1633495 RepID=UPI000780E242|nr:hypothetical protein [Endozoicomonas arenosclerae]
MPKVEDSTSVIRPNPEPQKKDDSRAPDVTAKIPRSESQRWDQKDLSSRKLTKIQSLLCFINRYFLKPLGILQGTFHSMLPDYNRMTDITEARMEEFWNRFDDPSKAYVLLFRNPHGNTGDSQHSAVVLGSTKGKKMGDNSSYVSWSFAEKDMIVGGFLARPKCNAFQQDFEGHGEPIVIELPSVNVAAMKHKWKLIRKNTSFYQLLGFNCSSVVARLLKAGVRSLDLVGEYQKSNPWGFWTPFDVSKLAEQMQTHLPD